MLPLEYKPKKAYELIRLGSENDGGYLICNHSLVLSKYLISFGLGSDWTFEKDFLKKNDCKFYGFDIKIKKYFWVKNILKSFEKLFKKKQKYKKFITEIKNNLKFRKFIRKKNVNLFEKAIARDGFSYNLSNIIDEFNIKDNFFLKIDIEGSEYRILDEIIKHENLITGFVVEFHDIDLHKIKIKKFINSLKLLKLIHIHPNNANNLCSEGDPTTIEMTFSVNPKIIGDKVELPNLLDKKTNEKNTDHTLNFET